jgi:hypothetical protein
MTVTRLANVVVREAVHRLHQGVLFFISTLGVGATRLDVVLLTTVKCGINAPIFMKLTQPQQHYVQNFCTYFHANRTVTLESTGKKK